MGLLRDSKIALFLGILLALPSCSNTPPKSGRDGDAIVHSIKHLILTSLRARRPEGPGANPRVGPGGPDYFGTPKPDASLDCKRWPELVKNFDLKEVRACLSLIPKNTSILYRVRFKAEPELELDEFGKKAPECVEKSLAHIPVPREIFFQSPDEGMLDCYSARLPIESENFMKLDLKWPLNRTEVRVTFPLEVDPKTDAQILTLLETWALAPYFDRTTQSAVQSIRARSVPHVLCQTCIGEDNLVKPTDPPPPLWPE